MTFKTIPLILAALVALGGRPASADDISDALDKAVAAYRDGDLAGARQATDLASTLIGQRSAAALAAALPGPLDGWTAEDASSDAAATSLFGGGIQAGRSYRNGEGLQVQIQVLADSPMVAQFAGIYSNPAMAAVVGKLVRVGGQQAIRTEDGEYQMMVGGRFMVTVSGDAPDDAKQAYAKAIDLSKLK